MWDDKNVTIFKHRRNREKKGNKAYDSASNVIAVFGASEWTRKKTQLTKCDILIKCYLICSIFFPVHSPIMFNSVMLTLFFVCVCVSFFRLKCSFFGPFFYIETTLLIAFNAISALAHMPRLHIMSFHSLFVFEFMFIFNSRCHCCFRL